MCATCGCNSGAKATIVNLATGRVSAIAHNERDLHHHVHEHVHADGTRHSHDHSDREHDHGHLNLEEAGHGHLHEHEHEHVHADGTRHSHSHDQANVHAHDHAYDHGPSVVDLEARLLAKNDTLAALNRAWFAGREILALNLVSSPGSGKTTLLERTIRDLKSDLGLFVVEGDQATTADGERIRGAGAPCVQVNTGTGCHLEADMIARGLDELKPSFGSVVLIENVGNLVCPALFDLGEHAKVAILSVTEGEDKPLKYPHMFSAAQVVLLNKIDLLPHLDFDIEKAASNIAVVNPDAIVFRVSARSGEGLDRWYDWIRKEASAANAHAV
jgi:hydrogenase nickel incorporation protein HypB